MTCHPFGGNAVDTRPVAEFLASLPQWIKPLTRTKIESTRSPDAPGNVQKRDLTFKEKDMNATQYGATYSTQPEDFGKITHIFPVSEDWDGYRFHGYCLPTQEDVAEFFGDQVAA